MKEKTKKECNEKFPMRICNKNPNYRIKMLHTWYCSILKLKKIMMNVNELGLRLPLFTLKLITIHLMNYVLELST